jgi:chromosome segregation ATPase
MTIVCYIEKVRRRYYEKDSCVIVPGRLDNRLRSEDGEAGNARCFSYALAEARAALESAQARFADLQAERDALETQRAELEQTVKELQDEVDVLQAKIDARCMK